MSRTLDRLRPDFAEANLPLHLLLGLLSATKRVSELLPRPRVAAPDDPAGAEPAPEPDTFEAFLLGIVAFHTGLQSLCSDAAQEQTLQAPATADSEAPAPPLRELLR